MAHVKLESDFKGLPGVSISCNGKVVLFTKEVISRMGISLGDTIAFRQDASGQLHIAVCPITDNISGNTACSFDKRIGVIVPMKYQSANINGRYVISDPFYSHGIDWFRLDYFKS